MRYDIFGKTRLVQTHEAAIEQALNEKFNTNSKDQLIFGLTHMVENDFWMGMWLVKEEENGIKAYLLVDKSG